MTRRRARLALIIASFTLALGSPSNAQSTVSTQPVDVTAKPWSAIGQVNTAAYGRCTGVLIARQLAVTAAHCLFNERTNRFLQPQSIHFVLGYDRGDYAFQTVAKTVRTGPAYDPMRPLDTIQDDWALLELADPAPDTIEPMPGSKQGGKTDGVFMSAGFGQDRLYRLTLVTSCRYLGRLVNDVIATDCTIEKGFSGGPLVDRDGGLVGIQVAGTQQNGREIALAVPTSAWSDQIGR